jgi:phosphomannomutase/phosphoglucomutase
MLDRASGKSMADLKDALPKTWSSPTMSPHCSDETKYGVVDSGVAKHFEAMQNNGEKVTGQKIRDLVTVNGVRVTVEDGSWGLVRASSNKPELVVVVESPVSDRRVHDLFEAMDSVLRTHPEVGEYNQKIEKPPTKPQAGAGLTVVWPQHCYRSDLRNPLAILSFSSR